MCPSTSIAALMSRSEAKVDSPETFSSSSSVWLVTSRPPFASIRPPNVEIPDTTIWGALIVVPVNWILSTASLTLFGTAVDPIPTA